MIWITQTRIRLGAICLALAVTLVMGRAAAEDTGNAPPDDFRVSKVQFTLYEHNDGSRSRDELAVRDVGGDRPRIIISREGASDRIQRSLTPAENRDIARLVWALRDRPATPNGFDTDLSPFGIATAERFTLSLNAQPSQDFRNFVLEPGSGDLDPDIAALTEALIAIGGFTSAPGETPPPVATAATDMVDDTASEGVEAPVPRPADADNGDETVADMSQTDESSEPAASTADNTADNAPMVTADMYTEPGDVEIRSFEVNLVGLNDAGNAFRRGRIFITEFGEDNPAITVQDALDEVGGRRKLTAAEARHIATLIRTLRGKPARPSRFSTDLDLFGLDRMMQLNVNLSTPPASRDFLHDFSIQQGEGYADPDAAALVTALLEAAGFVAPGESASRADIVNTSAADPVVEYCERDRGGAYFDCQCVGARADEARADLAEGIKARGIDRLEQQITRLESMKPGAADNPARLEGIESQLAERRQRLAEIRQAPPALASVESAMVMKYVTDLPACRSRAGTVERSFDGCMSATRAPEGAASAYCDCVAAHTADAWVSAETATSISTLGVPARRACAHLDPR